eukprot:GHVU01134122.1.p4 GENE.GHVU01134122.1~~GHVU01134122.1.p4  ORF type:complete len:230 (+),score=37.22 GHVU01134122.1:4046-4735(+)
MSIDASSKQVIWERQHELLLVDLVKPHLAAIEGTGNTSQNRKDRIAAWDTVHTQLVSQTGMQNTTSHKVKKKFQAMKSVAKAKQGLVALDCSATGGGPPSQVEFSQLDERLLSLFSERRSFVGEAMPVFSDVMAGAPLLRGPRYSLEEQEAFLLAAREGDDEDGMARVVDEDALAAQQHILSLEQPTAVAAVPAAGSSSSSAAAAVPPRTTVPKEEEADACCGSAAGFD